MKSPRIYTKSGNLSAYGFACGYIERKEKTINGVRVWKEMYMEHNHYHVRCNLKTTGSRKWQQWETFSSDELTKARKFYSSLKFPKAI